MALRLTPAQQKKKILAILANTDNISEACKAARCTRNQFNEMCASGFISKVELLDAHLSYGDRLLSRLNEAALDGMEVPVISHGKASIGADGKPLTRREYDMTLLRVAVERYLTSL